MEMAQVNEPQRAFLIVAWNRNISGMSSSKVMELCRSHIDMSLSCTHVELVEMCGVNIGHPLQRCSDVEMSKYSAY